MRARSFLQLVGAIFLPALPACGADVSYYAIIESQQFVQSSAAAPTLPATNAYRFDALVVASNTNSVTNATVLPPPSAPVRTLLPQPGGMELLFEERFDTLSELESAYTLGVLLDVPIYTVTMYGAKDGVRTGTLAFGTDGIVGSFPSTPQVNNFVAAQSVDTTAALTLLWTFSGGMTSDVVQVTVLGAASNTVFSSPSPLATNALHGTSNAFVIPPLALAAGTNFQAHLSVGRPVGVNTNSYPGALGVALLGMDVEFPLVTRPPPVHPRLTVLSVKPTPPRLQFFGETNRNYHFQFTTNLISWQDFLVTNSPTGTGIVADTTSTGLGRRFYRIQVGP
jgi:hypothetical protein